MLNKKWMMKLAVAGMALVFATTGCGEKDVKESAEPTQAVSPTITPAAESDEPTQSAEAKQLKQFADMAEDEVYAKINVENFGTITVKFFPEEAPKAVENFITHAKNGYYDGLTFHRVVDDFMIQGGDPEGTGVGGESIWGEDFEDEFSENLHPYRGALCMANAGSNTNGSQFFIIQADASTIVEMEAMLQAQYEVGVKEYFELGYQMVLSDEQVERYMQYGGTPWLYEHHTVFGQVMDGYDVLDAIAAVKVDGNSRPETKVVIQNIEVVE